MSKPYFYGILAVIGLFALFYLIVKVKEQKTSNQLHIADLYMEEEGFVDLTLSLTSRRSSKGKQALIAEGLIKEPKLALKCLLCLAIRIESSSRVSETNQIILYMF